MCVCVYVFMFAAVSWSLFYFKIYYLSQPYAMQMCYNKLLPCTAEHKRVLSCLVYTKKLNIVSYDERRESDEWKKINK